MPFNEAAHLTKQFQDVLAKHCVPLGLIRLKLYNRDHFIGGWVIFFSQEWTFVATDRQTYRQTDILKTVCSRFGHINNKTNKKGGGKTQVLNKHTPNLHIHVSK